MSRRVLVFRHGAAIPPGHLGTVLEGAGLALEVVDLVEGGGVPGDGDWDGVVSLGGAMGAYEVDEHPWIAPEQRFLAAAAGAGVPVLGICFGAQLLAAALGGRARPGAAGPEIGVVASAPTPAGAADPVTGGLCGPVPVWHGDTFDLPPGARLLAAGPDYPHAFRLGGAVGIQTHPEATPEIVSGWIATPRGAGELASAGIDPEGLSAAVEASAGETAAVADAVFGAWAASL